MAATITGVPEKISRAEYLRLIEMTGFELGDIMSLVFHTNSIEAVVIARDAAGKCYAQPDTNDVALHHISIPVED